MSDEQQVMKWLLARDKTALRLLEALGTVEGRDKDRMPILADALEQAGCSDVFLLARLREQGARTYRTKRGETRLWEALLRIGCKLKAGVDLDVWVEDDFAQEERQLGNPVAPFLGEPLEPGGQPRRVVLRPARAVRLLEELETNS
jgi:hypothetical protein